MVALDAFGIVRAYATTEQEWCVTVVGRKHAPVELLSTTAYTLTFSVEKIVVGETREGGRLGKVFCSGYIESLDYFNMRRCLRPNQYSMFRLLVAVQLNDVKGIFIG